MASLVLGVSGALSGNPLLGLAGILAGRYIDRHWLGPVIGPHSTVDNVGPRLDSVSVMSSAEGSTILRCYGRVRVDTQLIWATNFHEIVTTTTTHESRGGKGSTIGGLTGVQNVTTNTTTFSYTISFAVGLCEGPIVDIGRVWADGKPLDISPFTTRLYKGDETQGPDPKIEAVEGVGRAPAYRGTAYLVFEEMPAAQFGNRIPQLTVEVIRRPTATGVRIEDILGGVTMIPGLGEFAYAADSVYRDDGFGGTIAENRHGRSGKSDFLVALDELQAAAPNIQSVALVVSWHGTDLRCGVCEFRPKVEAASKTTTPWSWQVGGISRSQAQVVSSDAFGALLGGAPADRSIFQAIAELKARGLRVMLYPLIEMDIPSGNTLPNPYSNSAAAIGQPAFPWRGRITCSPAIGFTGTVDKTAAAATQISAFFGTAAPSDFGAWNGDTIPYGGPDEWSYRRMILHYAKLAAAAGGVDSFLIGSEMVSLTTVRSNASTFPAVDRLAALAADVKGIVGGSCKVGYAANWDEYANYRPADGSNDVYFHLDPLWTSPNIDFVGIDNYLPLSDWRPGNLHLDAVAGAKSIYDQAYLQGNIEGGELYDFFYASTADRNAQVRTPIIDTANGEPWVFRFKDFRNWWLNSHHNRPGGVRSAAATGWVPQSKPIRFTEFGCPAIDKGSNQPNVFFDPKSSESFFPYFSTGRRDDLIQRSFHEAIITYWNPANGHNPVSTVYGGRMVDHANLYAWTWDARPYPQFPSNTLIWRDGPNWRRGHWLNGRLGLVPLSDVVADITRGLGATVDVSEVNGIVRGYAIDNAMSAREALAPLMQIYLFDSVESSGVVRFVQRGGPIAKSFSLEDLVDGADSASSQEASAAFYSLTRSQETDLPRTVHLRFLDPDNDYQVADVYARRLRGASQRSIEITPAIVLDVAEAQGIADVLLIDAWVMREQASVVLPPSAYELEPSDVVSLTLNGRVFQMRLDELGYQHSRPARLTRTDAATYGASEGTPPTRQPKPDAEPGPVVLEILDLPLLAPNEAPGVPRLAAYAKPWARVNVFRSPSSTGFFLDHFVPSQAVIGKTLFDFFSGPFDRFDTVNSLFVQIPSDQSLSSLDDSLVLAGGNVCAIKNADGQWEVLQFATAELTAPNQYRLTRLLRGQLGSEYAMRNPVAAGASFVMLDNAVLQSSIAVTERHNPWNWKWGPSTKSIDDPTYQTRSFSFDAVGLRPYCPVQLSGVLNTATGDWILRWVRRTRIGGDNWEAPDVPIGEEIESYDVELVDAGTGAVVRTVTVSAPTFTYTSAMQVADFGASQSSIKFSVYQNSLAYGRGTVATKHLSSDIRI